MSIVTNIVIGGNDQQPPILKRCLVFQARVWRQRWGGRKYATGRRTRVVRSNPRHPPITPRAEGGNVSRKLCCMGEFKCWILLSFLIVQIAGVESIEFKGLELPLYISCFDVRNEKLPLLIWHLMICSIE